MAETMEMEMRGWPRVEWAGEKKDAVQKVEGCLIKWDRRQRKSKTTKLNKTLTLTNSLSLLFSIDKRIVLGQFSFDSTIRFCSI